jgi:hypothetical protein
MSVLDEDIKPKENFITGNDIESFLSEFNTPKQDVKRENIPEYPEEDIPEDIAQETEEPKKVTRRAAKATAGLLTTAIIAPVSAVCTFVAKSDNPKKYAFTDDERETLDEALAKYLELKGSDIPPGVMLLVVILTIIGGKIMQAFRDRSENTRLQEAEKRANALQAEIDRLRLEKERENGNSETKE